MDPSAGSNPGLQAVLDSLVEAGRLAFEQNLRSVVLFGSAAEDRLRSTSDVNLMVVLHRFDAKQADAFRESLRLARAAVRASVMFVLASELPAAAEAFAVKFSDMARRHRLLFGEDLLASLTPSRQARLQRLRQVILNTTLRLREKYANLQEEQLPLVIADTASALRSAAGALMDLEGRAAHSSREALELFTQGLARPDLVGAVGRISTARETRSLPPGEARATVLQILELLGAMSHRAAQLVER